MGSKVTAGGKGFSAEVTIEGLVELRAALKAFEPEVLKRMDREIREVSKDLKNAADAKFSATGVSGGYVVRRSNSGKKVGQKVTTASGSSSRGMKWGEQPGVLAAIYEFANGVRSTERAGQAQSLINTLNSRYGSTGRFLWSAWDSMKGTAIPRIEASVRRAEKDLQASLDARGVAY